MADLREATITAAIDTGSAGMPVRLLLAPFRIAVSVAIRSCVQVAWLWEAGCQSLWSSASRTAAESGGAAAPEYVDDVLGFK